MTTYDEHAEYNTGRQLSAGGKQDDPTTIFFTSIFSPIMNSMKVTSSDDTDWFLRLDPAHAEWTNEKSGDKISEDHGCLKKWAKTQAPCKQDA
jgi:hypothetical protein